jgi:hypothetical protein
MVYIEKPLVEYARTATDLATLQRENAINSTVLAVTSWHVWEARNEYRNNGIFLPPLRVVTRALGYVDMILNFMFKQKVAKQR